MARRTKEDAQQTRNRILDAAEQVFERRGVSRATLNEIGAQAGVTRGAIYWHFEDKADIFDAMMLRATLPLEQHFQHELGSPGVRDPVGAIRRQLAHALREIVENPSVRRVLEIALHKVEYVDELAKVRSRRIETCRGHRARMAIAFQQAIDSGQLAPTVDPAALSTGLHGMIDGLVHNWMLEPGSFDLVSEALGMFDTVLATHAGHGAGSGRGQVQPA